MATNFNNSEVSSSLRTKKSNMPLDIRTRIESIGEVENIPLPYIGMIFYVIDEEKCYVVKSLKAKQIIGYIADSPDMFLKLTGMEFINFIANIYKVPLDVRKKRIKEFGERFGLSDVLDKPMQSYSHGMRQKIMVVAALVHDPDVWILDEPLIGLDPTSAFELKKMMREHADKGNSVFFSTHVLEVAEKLCDKIAIIDKGKVVFIGTLKELKDKYDKKDLEELFMEVIKHE